MRRRPVQFLRQLPRIVQLTIQHPANRHGQLAALARLLRYQVSAILKSNFIVRFGERSIIQFQPGTSLAKVAYMSPPDWREMMAWKRLLRPGDLFCDVGANRGLYTIWALDCGARVIAIEPEARERRYLEENLQLNSYQARVIPFAIAERNGSVAFVDGLGSKSHVQADGTESTVDIPATTIDDVLAGRRCRGIKLDIEGAERLALEGATDSLAHQRIDAIQLEWNNLSRRFKGESRQSEADLLTGFGYRLVRPDDFGVLKEVPNPTAFGPDIFAVSPSCWPELQFV